jgi:hypothetical protein
MHLGSRHEFSTFRLSLGSILAQRSNRPEIEEVALSKWMRDHLRLVAIPVADADNLDSIETQVLRALDPPLNLNEMSRSPVRARLTELRRGFSRRAR